ncbi:MAG TPA: bacillithiol system redox-active protein YtxJ [Pyrinomonadaceae bacterium]|nr:bacillithiol system redox-active protein YtxJ [Pyrinomonadaceae bacterium]
MANFIEIDSPETLETLFQQSFDVPILLFKHSVTCPISTNVYDEVSAVEGEINLVIVQKARNISNLIAEKTEIRHQSPQAIILRDGKAIYHASHYDITAEDINSEMRSKT